MFRFGFPFFIIFSGSDVEFFLRNSMSSSFLRNSSGNIIGISSIIGKNLEQKMKEEELMP